MPFFETESLKSRDAELDALFAMRGPERAMRLGLERVDAALTALGSPHRKHPSLLVAGTNGKGTTSLYLTGALVESGYSVGTFLSPHLYDVRERYLHNLEAIDAEQLIATANEVKPLADQFELTWFEHAAVTFFLWTSRLPLDFLVVEVGMGGRLDATNVLDPVATVLTNVGLDHQAYLGDTVEAILGEKLGVVKAESLLFTGIDDPALREQVQKTCDAVDAIYYYAGETKLEVESADWDGQNIRINDEPFHLACPTPGAAANAKVALLCLRIAIPKVSLETIRRGFARVRNPGRFETVAQNPRVVVSGDHNLDGLGDLLSAMQNVSGASRAHVICGFTPERPFAAMVDRLAPLSKSLALVPVPGRDDLPAGYAQHPAFQEDWETALQNVLAVASADDTILVTGSLYLAGAVRRRFRPTVAFESSELSR